jgi:hypothetical protein
MLATAWFDGAKLAGRALVHKADAAGQLRGPRKLTTVKAFVRYRRRFHA